MENFKKLRLVGRGAHGTVYLSHRKSDNKLVITKEIPVDQMSVEERQVSMNEAKVLSMLDHPNVIAYYDSFLEEKTLIIVMEYVQGGTLFDFLNSRNGNLMTEEEILHYFGQMVYTLQHVHTKLILHRDLKSQNILLNERRNVVKIGDFGISKVLSTKSKAYTVVGTPCYISPELCEGKPYNQKSDIWALGCVLYELMTLKRPFDATTLPALIMKIMKGSFEPVSNTYSYELRKLLLSMLHLDPNQRPSAAQIMCQPVMIKAIFKLYVDIGSIPCTYKAESPSTKRASHLQTTDANLEPTDARRFSLKMEEKSQRVWFCDGKSPKKTLLPLPANTMVKSVALGSDQKIGLSESGQIINWKIRPRIAFNSESSDCENQEAIFIPHVIDEKIAANITSVACGELFTVCLSDNGVVYTFGKASSGCLGYASNRDVHQPKIVEALFSNNIKNIACGPKHVLALSEEKELFAWGHGVSGCLGMPSSDSHSLPKVVKIPGEFEIKSISCGDDCSFIITEDSKLLVCGSNRHNKIGLDSEEGSQIDSSDRFSLVKSELLQTTPIARVSSGKSHTVVLTETGDIFSFGANRYGQLGWGKAGMDYSLPRKVEVVGDSKVHEVACGDNFTVAVTCDKYQNSKIMYWGKYPSCLEGENDGTTNTPAGEKAIQLSAFCYSDSCFLVETVQ